VVQCWHDATRSRVRSRLQKNFYYCFSYFQEPKWSSILRVCVKRSPAPPTATAGWSVVGGAQRWVAGVPLSRLLQTSGQHSGMQLFNSQSFDPNLNSTQVNFNRVGLYRLKQCVAVWATWLWQPLTVAIVWHPRCGSGCRPSSRRRQSTTAFVCTKYPPPRRPTATSPSQWRPQDTPPQARSGWPHDNHQQASVWCCLLSVSLSFKFVHLFFPFRFYLFFIPFSVSGRMIEWS